MPNRLIREKSPYLLQHAHNPVDWYPWGEEAFALARAEQKPIFLSVGYSTCHWCHVMEAESFESPAIASLMNRDFVNIKVDREERPDVDRVYMSALHAMGENGGWPMSMFLTPDLRPFYGGTYFPPATRYGRIGFPDLLQRIRTIWATERSKVLESASGLTEHLRASVTAVRSERVPGAGVLDLAFSQFARTYDTHAGGFGGAPKFPRPAVFKFLLGYAARTGNAEALAMTTTSLHRMARGGVYDHLGGGFHRYAVDAEWRVPHFEKMLYDQAQLVHVYLDAYLVTKERFFAEVAEDVVRYVLRDLALPEGGFCSAEDADSPKPDSPGETGEGAFYLWTREELDTVLDEPTANAFALAFGIESGGNAAVDPHSEFGGKNILFRARTDEQVASFAGLPVESVAALLYSARTLLANVRATRPRPGRDDKVLASWNGLMIGACARAGALLSAPRFVDAAVRAADFVMHRLYDGTRERLIRRYRDGEAKHDAHLEDYAFTASGLLDLYEATFDARWLRHALHLTKVQMSLFRDEQSGGFLDTSGEDPSILVRTREQYDGAEPSGNSVAALTLLRLAHLTGDRSFQDAGEDVLRTFAPVLQEHPHAVPFMATALAFHHGSGREIVIAGRRGEPRTEALVTEVRKRYLPESVIVYVQAGEKGIAAISPFAASLARQNDEATAYVCERQTCRLPTADPAELGRILDGQPPGTDLR